MNPCCRCHAAERGTRTRYGKTITDSYCVDCRRTITREAVARHRRRQWTTGEVAQMAGYAGRPVRFIADAMGVSYGQAWGAARRFGIPTQPEKWSAATVDRVRRMRADGLSVREIASATGVPFGTVRHWIYSQVRA